MELLEELRETADLANEQKRIKHMQQKQQLQNVVEEIIASCRAQAALGEYDHLIRLKDYTYLMQDVEDFAVTIKQEMAYHGITNRIGQYSPKDIIFSWERGEDR